MADLDEQATWEEGIRRIDRTDALDAGVGGAGLANLQPKQLANRTRFLLRRVDGQRFVHVTSAVEHVLTDEQAQQLTLRAYSDEVYAVTTGDLGSSTIVYPATSVREGRVVYVLNERRGPLVVKHGGTGEFVTVPKLTAATVVLDSHDVVMVASEALPARPIVITSVTPATAPPGVPISLTLEGKGFLGIAAAEANFTTVALAVVSDTELTVDLVGTEGPDNPDPMNIRVFRTNTDFGSTDAFGWEAP